jgi:putative endonuclease
MAQGHELVERNWRCEAGEIDLVTRDGECLAIVEVRARRGRRLGSPEESITEAKRMRLLTLGEAYVQTHDWHGHWRIDVVAIEMDRRGQVQRLDHYEDAISG